MLVGTDKKVMRANPDIGYRIKRGALGFINRKIYNSFVYRAQKAGQEAKGVLPYPLTIEMREYLERAGVDVKQYWWMPITDLADDVTAKQEEGVDVSRMRVDRVRNYLLDLKSVVVERNAVGWEVDSIIGSARIINNVSPNLSQKGGYLMVGWNFPQSIERQILQPDEYTRMSLYYQGLLKTEQALCLYEICKREVCRQENSGRGTVVIESMPWEEWYTRLVGEPGGPTMEYKAWKRRIKGSLLEINGITDLDVSLIEGKRPGTKVVDTWKFVIELKPQQVLELEGRPVVDLGLLADLENLGVSPLLSERLLEEHGEEKARKALEYTTAQQRLTKVNNPAAYFKRALLENYADAAQKQTEAKKKRAAESGAEYEALKNSSGDKTEVVLPEGEELDNRWAEFCVSLPGKMFKQLPSSFGGANNRQIEAFKGWLK